MRYEYDFLWFFLFGFSINSLTTIPSASAKRAFPAIVWSVLAENFTRSADELEGIPGTGMKMEKAQWPQGHLTVSTSSDGLPG